MYGGPTHHIHLLMLSVFVRMCATLWALVNACKAMGLCKMNHQIYVYAMKLMAVCMCVSHLDLSLLEPTRTSGVMTPLSVMSAITKFADTAAAAAAAAEAIILNGKL